MFTSVKTPGPHKSNLRAEKTFCVPRWDICGVCMHHGEETCAWLYYISEIMNQIV